MDRIELHEPISCFDLDGNGRMGFDDVVTLFGMIY